MTVSVALLDELERRLIDLQSAIEDVRNDGSCMTHKDKLELDYHYGTRACGRLKRKILDVYEIGAAIRRGDRE